MISNYDRMRLIRNGVLTALCALSMVSCSMFHDNLPPCPEKPATVLTFSYKYNLLNADAFASQVHCVDVYVFDEEGKFVIDHHEENNDLIKTGTFSVSLQLEPGGYQAIVYGGTACSEASFEKLFEVNPSLTIEDLEVAMKNSFYYDESEDTGNLDDDLDDPDNDLDRANLKLHDYFFGTTSFRVSEDMGSGVQPVEVPMMRNTNTIQVSLQNISGEPIDVSDFHFTISDDNNTFDNGNNLTTSGEISYRPFSKINKSTGLTEDGENVINVAVAHFTVSRIVIDKPTTPMLKVDNAEGENVINLPIVNYMMLFKNEYYSDMDDQEYLDRENNWKFIFFLDDSKGGSWITTRIVVNDWEVREDIVES